MAKAQTTSVRTPFLFLALISLAALGSACGSGGSANARTANANSAEAPPIAITVAKTESRNVPAFIQATGSLLADETSNVAPKVAGKVANVTVNVGQFVAQGAEIAKLDDKDARLQRASAQAGVKQAIAAVRQAEARLGLSPNGAFNASAIPEVRQANANYEQMLAELRQAEANEKRYRDLVETGDDSMVVYEQHRTPRDTARARLNSARKQLEEASKTARHTNAAI